MLGAVLLLLVILNAFCTGWLLATVVRMRRVVRQLGREQRALAHDFDNPSDSYVLEEV